MIKTGILIGKMTNLYSFYATSHSLDNVFIAVSITGYVYGLSNTVQYPIYLYESRSHAIYPAICNFWFWNWVLTVFSIFSV